MEEPGTIQRTALYSIQRIHTIAGQQAPRKHPAIYKIMLTLEDARRRLGKPVSPYHSNWSEV